ncbi:MAG TPA: WXG100 family type VII secretion target [Anaerolineales bacterium]|nr:WXG100 family type VII secretion target [Anaerolineales bacterium]HRF48706.1 WXG100 family type VII secretion target [Anaerolineales bacterium]
MAHDRVRGNHDELKQISSLFAQEAENTQKSIQDLANRMETLKGGDWIGKGAKQFYNEMDSAVMPAMKRLNKALQQGSKVTKDVANKLREAEQSASACLNGANLRI